MMRHDKANMFTLLLPFCFIRPLQDECFTSDPKRVALECPISVRPPNASDTRDAPLDSAADLFPGQSEGRRDSFSLSVQAELNHGKRKEMEEDIEMDELESIMSLDLDFSDELPAVTSQQAQTLIKSSHEKKHSVDTVEASSACKRPRLHFEEAADRRQQRDAKKENNSKEKAEQPAVKTEEPHLSERSSAFGDCSRRPQISSSTTHTSMKAFEDVEVRRCLHS